MLNVRESCLNMEPLIDDHKSVMLNWWIITDNNHKGIGWAPTQCIGKDTATAWPMECQSGMVTFHGWMKSNGYLATVSPITEINMALFHGNRSQKSYVSMNLIVLERILDVLLAMNTNTRSWSMAIFPLITQSQHDSPSMPSESSKESIFPKNRPQGAHSPVFQQEDRHQLWVAWSTVQPTDSDCHAVLICTPTWSDHNSWGTILTGDSRGNRRLRRHRDVGMPGGAVLWPTVLTGPCGLRTQLFDWHLTVGSGIVPGCSVGDHDNLVI